MTKWAYRTVAGSLWGSARERFEAELNSLGLDGWEAVSMVAKLGVGQGDVAVSTTVLLKRPMTADDETAAIKAVEQRKANTELGF